MHSTLQRLKERKFVQWVLAYLAGAWLLLEAVDMLGGRWGLTPALGRAVDVVLVGGFFVTLVLAWYHGERGRQSVSAPELIILAGLLAVGGLALRVLAPIGESDIAVEPGFGVIERDRPAIAVLPFANISPNATDAYFAEGIHEQIISQLAKISALSVISRSSVLRYEETRPTIREVAEALSVDFVLEGSWRTSGDRVRLTAQLIDARTDEHLWNADYDRDLSLEDLFDIQDDLAARVAQSASAQILPSEAASISRRPTSDLDAYQHYLLGLSHWGRRSENERRVSAVEAFRAAVAADPDFGVAWAMLGSARLWLRQLDENTGNDQLADLGYSASGLLDSASTAIQRADALAPEALETFVAHGDYHYYGVRDLPRALEEFRRAESVLPGSPELVGAIANVQRRMGDWEDALAGHLERAAIATPQAFYTAAMTARMMRRYEQALSLAEQGINLSADFRSAWGERYRSYLQSGDTASAWETAASYRAVAGEEERPQWRLDEVRFREGHTAAARLGEELFPMDSTSLGYLRRRWFAKQEVPASAAAIQIDERRAQVTKWDASPNRFLAITARGRLVLALAVSGRGEEASKGVDWVLDQNPMAIDALVGWNAVNDALFAAMILGDVGQATRAAEALLASPSYLSVALFRLDPFYDTIRDEPSFEALLERYSQRN